MDWANFSIHCLPYYKIKYLFGDLFNETLLSKKNINVYWKNALFGYHTRHSLRAGVFIAGGVSSKYSIIMERTERE